MTLLLFSCNDKFLDTKPIATSDESAFFATMESADLATTTCYSNFSMEKLWDLSIVMTMGSIASDEAECGAGGKNDVVEFQAIDQLRQNANTPNVFDQTYGYLYRSINYCNVVLEKLPEIPASAKGYNAEIISERMGEAYFLRAFNYFYLTMMYGGVPLVDHQLAPSEYYQPRADISDIYTLMKSDLRSAMQRLPERSEWGTSDIGRASKGAAEALMAKLYLYESSYAKYYPSDPDNRFVGLSQHWDSVVYWAEKVIGSGEYELIGSNGERYDSWRDPANGVGGYTWIFQVGANNSKEEVFSIQSRMDGLGWFYSRGTPLDRWAAPRGINAPDGSVTEAVPGWGWWCPSDYMVDAFSQETGNPADDPRYKATVMEDTDSLLYWTGSAAVWVTPNYSVLQAATGVHRSQRKYEASPDEYWAIATSWKEGPTNVKMIRYADVILWNAEAYFEMGNNAKALENINLVRTRARMSGNTGFPKDLTGTLTHDDIVHERMIELGLEGHRYFDLIRWNLGSKYLNHELSDGDKITFQPGREFYPLPAAEVQLSKGKLKQYPHSGY